MMEKYKMLAFKNNVKIKKKNINKIKVQIMLPQDSIIVISNSITVPQMYFMISNNNC